MAGNKNFKDYAIAGQNVTLTYDDIADTVTINAQGGGDVTSVNGQIGDVILDKTDIGLGNVDNTSDANKPISLAVQTALNSKQDALTYSPENSANKSISVDTDKTSDVKYPSVKSVYTWGVNLFATSVSLTTHISDTNNPHAVTKAQVGLSNVDNTSDVNKPISTATQTALNLKQDSLGFTPENIANKSTSVSTDSASNTKYPSVKSVYDWAVGLFATQSSVALKQDIITLTTTGSSGAASFLSNVLNIPNYTLSGLGGVPTTRTLTINGTALDLSANRSWTVGDLLSSGSYANPSWITSLAFSKITGYSVPTLDQVTTAGATTTNAISVGRLTVNTSSLIVFPTTFNIGINTATDAGYKLDVNGTARIQGDLSTSSGKNMLFGTTLPSRQTNSAAYPGIFVGNSNSCVMGETTTGYKGILINANLVRDTTLAWVCQDTTKPAWSLGLNYDTGFTDSFTIYRAAATSGAANTIALFQIKGSGNVLIATTTDSGYKFDVNGSTRLNGALTLGMTPIVAASVVSTHKLQITIAGTTYYLLATNV